MAAKKLGFQYPQFVIKAVADEHTIAAFKAINELVNLVRSFRTRAGEVVDDHATRLTPSTGSGAPGTTPSDTLLWYLDTSAKDMYVSVGTASSADWKKVTP